MQSRGGRSSAQTSSSRNVLFQRQRMSSQCVRSTLKTTTRRCGGSQALKLTHLDDRSYAETSMNRDARSLAQQTRLPFLKSFAAREMRREYCYPKLTKKRLSDTPRITKTMNQGVQTSAKTAMTPSEGSPEQTKSSPSGRMLSWTRRTLDS
jgi:hypothetical protein